ncbi:MAG TPA: hypothetical protein DEQ32_09440 [Gammaproteobacteria bacterium]|jgi:hypothetical protein|nr:hypothetical protein [Gammaproteobacteria bacterium]|tara:strand:+ start:513 stop:1127 length:615 start_codon:yes stop_codon:yes gene_type:complete
MRHKELISSGSGDAFTDLLFNALLGFAMMFIIAFMLISDPDEEGKVEAKAEMLITVRWPDQHPDDVDALIEGPQGEVVWYHNRDSGLMHLDRDDRGLLADRVTMDGKTVINPINQETVTVRALQSGEYTVNLLHYQSNYGEPLPVTVKVEKLNPEVSLVHYGKIDLKGTGDEQTAVRFRLDSEGNVLGTNRLQKRLLTQALNKP